MSFQRKLVGINLSPVDVMADTSLRCWYDTAAFWLKLMPMSLRRHDDAAMG